VKRQIVGTSYGPNLRSLTKKVGVTAGTNLRIRIDRR